MYYPAPSVCVIYFGMRVWGLYGTRPEGPIPSLRKGKNMEWLGKHRVEVSVDWNQLISLGCSRDKSEPPWFFLHRWHALVRHEITKQPYVGYATPPSNPFPSNSTATQLPCTTLPSNLAVLIDGNNWAPFT